MKYTIITQNSIYNLSADYIKHMYPSDKLYKSCIALSNEDVKNLRFKDQHLNATAGPLKILPNKVNGAARKQKLLEDIDKASRYNATKLTDRLNWKGKNIPPARKGYGVAPISIGSSLTKKTTTRAGAAMAVGIVLDKARAAILYRTIRKALNIFSQTIHTKNSNSIGAVFIIKILYLKVDTSYGRVPTFSGIYLTKLINSSDNFYAIDYINNVIHDICVPKFQEPLEKIEQVKINELDHPNLYETATLFVQCNW